MFTGHQGEVTDLEWNNDGISLASTGIDGTVRTWNIIDQASQEVFSTIYPIRTTAYSPFGGRLAVGGVFQVDVASLESIDNLLSDDTFQITVPDPSIERLQAIADQCDAPISVEQAIPADAQTEQLTDFISEVQALPVDSIPPACAADLIAVAEAIQAGQ